MSSFKINPSIFREYDIRGIADSDLPTDFARRLGEVYAEHLKENAGPGELRERHTVAVGKDCRISSDRLAEALIEGIRCRGVDVIRIGVCPTPLTYYSTFHLGLDGAIMVTGSHNPGEYNGFKICVGRTTIHGQEIQTLRERMERSVKAGPLKPVSLGSLIDYAIIPAYVEYLRRNARKLRPLKIVIDAGNGTASTVAPVLFRLLGAEVFPLFCELDGRFPNHHPDPTVPSNLKDLVTEVLARGADFGVAFDGDSDRIGVVDDRGKILFGDEIMVLFSRDVLAENPGATIISEVKSSNRLYDDIRLRGGNAVMWKTGHSLIKSKMKETKAALAGEMSGHIFFADRYFGYDDAIYAALRVFEIVSASDRPLSALLEDLPSSVSTPEIRVACEDTLKFRLVDEARRLIRKIPGASVNEIDGVRADFGHGWGLVRASNTQPVIVLRFESSSNEKLNDIRAKIESCLEKAAKAVGHPALDLKGSLH